MGRRKAPVSGQYKSDLTQDEVARRVFGDGATELFESEDERAAAEARMLDNTIVMDAMASGDTSLTLVDASIMKGKTRIVHVDLMVLAYQYMQGMTAKQSAIHFGASEGAINKARASSQFKATMAMLTEATTQAVKVYISGATMKAAHVLTQLLDSDSEKIQLAAAAQILDRAGVKAADKLEVTSQASAVHNMSESELLALVKTAIKELPAGVVQ